MVTASDAVTAGGGDYTDHGSVCISVFIPRLSGEIKEGEGDREGDPRVTDGGSGEAPRG